MFELRFEEVFKKALKKYQELSFEDDAYPFPDSDYIIKIEVLENGRTRD